MIDQYPASARPCVCPSVREQLLKTSSLKSSQKVSLGDALSENFKDLNSMKNCGCHGNRKKTLEIFLSQTMKARAFIFGM